jgi:hypothetical protein
MTIDVVQEPAHGNLNERHDGSFRYKATRVRRQRHVDLPVWDGVAWSNTVTVTMTVAVPGGHLDRPDTDADTAPTHSPHRPRHPGRRSASCRSVDRARADAYRTPRRHRGPGVADSAHRDTVPIGCAHGYAGGGVIPGGPIATPSAGRVSDRRRVPARRRRRAPFALPVVGGRISSISTPRT